MAWESRNGRRYYYRTKRVDGRVIKVYLGSGKAAQQAAAEDTAAKAVRARDAAELTALQASLIEADQITTEAAAGVNLLLEAELLAMGYHKRRGEWRRKRE